MELDLIKRLEAEVVELADESAAELLPLLFEKFMSREGLVRCKRHAMLKERVQAEIALRRAKRWDKLGYVHRFDENFDVVYDTNLYEKTLKKTLAIRKKYRSLPCTCWVTKR